MSDLDGGLIILLKTIREMIISAIFFLVAYLPQLILFGLKCMFEIYR